MRLPAGLGLSFGGLAGTAFGAGRHFNQMADLAAAVVAELPQAGSVLVKGSRFMKMEQVVQAIADHTQNYKEET